jgi:hypothetical protein
LNRHIAYRDFGILVALFSIPLDVAIHETPIWSYVNGPDLISIQRLRLNREFTYREIGVPDVNNFCHVQLSIPDASPLTGINGPDQSLI